MAELFYTPDTWISLITLSLLEIVLGIDNLVFMALTTERLPAHLQQKAWKFGLSLACITRLLLLATVDWLSRFTLPLFTLLQHPFSARDCILISGGLFLLVKGSCELWRDLSIIPSPAASPLKKVNAIASHSVKKRFLWGIILQIGLLDLVFSIDSVMAAVAMAQHFTIMALSVLIAIGLMLVASKPLSRIVNTHPRLKILAIGFILLIGLILVLDGFNLHIPRAYIYTIMAFATFVEYIRHVRNKRIGRFQT